MWDLGDGDPIQPALLDGPSGGQRDRDRTILGNDRVKMENDFHLLLGKIKVGDVFTCIVVERRVSWICLAEAASLDMSTGTGAFS